MKVTTTVDDYIEKQPLLQKEILKRLRKIIFKTFPVWLKK